ncbi:P-loop containing nucleoside triphosphate hydrolase protein [Saccharata proteae CBS 121410]|uniref:RNA helicase n=1 Tax=Saccharata proteae CBS 121410 TaxID=1314787 RepID=A0A9P4LVS5_9PEZI|nr:P-loop containing nucleoside triphosphate hydrolase protein [Saccharata proteae CBS 121410]
MPKFVPRQRKHKVLARQQREGTTNDVGVDGADANAAEIMPASKTEREEKRRKLREELKAEKGKMSGKKQKRLDKYIDTKLKKEENLELIKKLALHKVDTSLFQSAKKLGRTTESRKEAVSRALQEKQAGIDVEKNESIAKDLSRPEKKIDGGYHTDSDEEGEEKPEVITKKRAREEEPEEEVQGTKAETATATAFGSGLKKPLELDENGRPIIQRRKRAKVAPTWKAPVKEIAWDGFDSNEDEDSDTDASGSGSDEEEDEDDSDEEGDEDEESSDEEGSSEEEESEDEEMDDGAQKEAKKERSSAFKAWATQERNKALGFTPSSVIQDSGSLQIPKPANFKPRAMEEDPLPPELATKTPTDSSRKAYSVSVERPPEVQEGRMALPVVAEEQKIMEAIHNNDVVVVWGATGSGKTTQVPQFLFESGYGDRNGPTPGMIGVTQPRRVAAVSMAKRVAQELGSAGSRVGHQIRFDTSAGENTAVKFMTDGILLREIAQDISLPQYSAIVIDEAHERSVNTDILIGMMSRIVDLRRNLMAEDPKVKPLKLVIMSATLRISDFTQNARLFRHGAPPLLQAEGRQYPVTVHFSRRTRMDYLEEAFSKIKRGHKKLPPGGMLVFLTGQNEITNLARGLRQAFPSTQGAEVKAPPVRISAADAPVEAEDLEIGDDGPAGEDYDDGSDSDSEIHGMSDEDDEEFDIGEDQEDAAGPLKVHVLPLYSQLPTKQQMRVFEPPPDGSRLIVLATNVAETSLTIPGIRYVFDCGRSKERKYDQTTGVQSFEVGWISKASAEQRAGRAGRTGPGHCYRFYSSAVYERDFLQYTEPEILRAPIEGLVLQLKSMGIHKVVNYPFPTPPDRQNLAKAEKLLTYLGAIDDDGKITKMGRQLSVYPLSPRFARMLVVGQNHNLTAYIIALVSALAVPDLFTPENQLNISAPPPTEDGIRTITDNREEEAREKRRKAYNTAHGTLAQFDRQSDASKLLAALCAFAAETKKTSEDFAEQWFLRLKALQEATQLRQQLSNIVRKENPSALPNADVKALKPPSKDQIAKLNYIVAAGFVDQVAIRADLSPSPPGMARKPRRAIDVPYITLFPSSERQRFSAEEDEMSKFVFIHPSSVLAHQSPTNLPQYIIYSHLQRAAPSTIGSSAGKVRMHALTPVTGTQLAALAKGTPLLEYGKPVGKIVEKEGEGGRERECFVVPSLVGERGGLGWPLPAKKVVQRREGGKGWVVKEILS